MAMRERCFELALSVATMVWMTPVLAQDSSFAAEKAQAIESCVDSAPIRFQQSDVRASLDAADTTAVASALMSRYPAVQQAGFEPQGVVLWNKPGTGWVYVALIANPEKPQEVCFTATFSASRFDTTAPLLSKYFGIAQEKAVI